MIKQSAKEKIKKLIGEYERLKRLDEISDKNEAFTKQRFIQPFFEALGWNFREDVWPEEKVSKDRVDYAFKTDDFIKFFVEAKKFSVDLDEERWAEQAIDYAWNKSVTWAVISDFEGLKIFNSEWNQKPYRAIKEFNYTEYLDRFEEIWLLSKESINKGELDKIAEAWGIKERKIPVTEQLAKDLTEWRDLMTQEIKDWNKDKYTEEEISEAVQRFLDRLIFIRYAEDKGLEPIVLEPILKEVKEKGGNLIEKLNKLFRQFDRWYDSRLFEPHFSEEMEAYSGNIEKIIEGLYRSNKTGHPYDFSAISADVLGAVYEQYLGYIQKRETDNGNKKSKRKEQGIYYTPNYVVDFIVQNTLGEILNNSTLREIKNIKILDPACGSGSFLINAYQTLIDHYQKISNYKIDTKTKIGKIEKLMLEKKGIKELTVAQKMNILRENIYGIDLDEKAVEIAQLNLNLKAISRRTKLPNLSHKIVCGNSLISKGDKSLKPFNWQREFKEVFDQGGFDVVIGNPPYLKEMDNKNIFKSIKNSDYKKYYQGKMDFWYFFLHRAIDVVKDNGYIGFITNSYFLKSTGASKLIERIKNELVLIKAVDLDDIKVFGDVSGKHIIHIYQKCPAKKSDKTILISISKDGFNNIIDEENKKTIPYQKLIINNKINFESTDILDFKNCVPLGNVYDVSVGVQESTDKVTKKQVTTSSNFKAGDGVFVLSKDELESLKLTIQEKQVIKKYLDTNDVGKYFIDFHDKYLIYSDKEVKDKIKNGACPNIKAHLDKMNRFITSSNKPYGLHRPRENKYFESAKLICKGMFLTPEFCYDEDKYYVGFSFSVIIQKDKDYSLKYLLGLLNSNLGKNWFNKNGKKRGIGVDIGVLVFRQFPVYKANKKEQGVIIRLVDIIHDLNKDLKNVTSNSDQWYKIKNEIEKTSQEIDQKVYELYGLTGEEIKIIKNN